MSVITCLVAARGWPAVALLGCLLARPASAACPLAEKPCFQAVSLAAAQWEAATLPASPEPVSFAAFVPTPGAATLRALIERLEDEGEAYSPAIAEHSAELGRRLQAEGRHRAALQALDRSLQILRRHEGLASLAQVALLEAKAESLLALSDWESADALQQALLLQRRELHTGDPGALADAEAAWADWNVRYYFLARQRLLNGTDGPEQKTGLAERLGQALLGYHRARALQPAPAAVAGQDPRVDLERRIAALTLLGNGMHRQHMPSLFTKAGGHSLNQSRRANHALLTQHGLEALLRALDYARASGDARAVAQRQLELGDWYLFLDQHREAYAAYERALSSLREAGLSDLDIDEAAGSGLPLPRPDESLLAPSQESPEGGFDGFLDVAIDVDPYGRPANARILAGQAHDAEVEARLLQRIRADRFRPALDERGKGRAGEARLRYYFLR